MKSLLLFAFLSCIIGGSLTPKSFDSKKKIECDPLSMYTTPEEVYPVARVFNDVGLSFEDSNQGSGIKVGIIERSAPLNKSDFPGVTYVSQGNDFDVQHYKHAEYMLSIMKGEHGVAKDATVYLAVNNDNMSFENCVNKLVNQYHVDVISCSLGKTALSGNYTYSESYFLDNIVKTKNVLFVAAAGNSDRSYYKTPESLGLNVLSVGASDKDLKASSVNTRYTTVAEYSDVIKCKPTLLAPGDSVFGFHEDDQNHYCTELREGHLYDNGSVSGTSVSTPIVAGIAARLMQRFPALKGNPERIISLLCNTCEKANGQTEYFDSTNGFGIVNYRNAVKAASASAEASIAQSDTYGKLIYNTEVTIPSNKEFRFTSFGFLSGLYNHAGAPTYVAPSELIYPKLNIYLYNPSLLQTGPVATGTIYSNISSLSYFNNTNYTTFRVRVTLNNNDHQTGSVAAGFSAAVISEENDNLVMTEAYLDWNPTFTYSITSNYQNVSGALLFFNYLGTVILSKTISGLNGSITLTRSEWTQLINLRGREFYASMYIVGNNSFSQLNIRMTKLFVFEEPQTFCLCTQLAPKDWGFAEQYYFYEQTTSKTVDGIGITTRRLRCGYIRNMYINLSPRRKDAGNAYFEMVFDRPIYGFMFGITMWRQGELIRSRTGDSAVVETLNENNEWVEGLDLLNDINLPISRRQVDRYEIFGVFYGIRFRATSNPTGTSNNGRICIDDIVLNTNSVNVPSFYEPIVENNTFIA